MTRKIYNMRKTVLYIIESLGLGGAEMLVVSQLPEVHKKYNVVLVTLNPLDQFEPGQLVFDHFYCLEMSAGKNIFSAAKKLRSIIKEHNVDLVHSVLYWSVMVARLACGNKTKHISSLAVTMSHGAYSVKWYSGLARVLDKLTYKKSETLIGASNEVLHDFNDQIGIKGRSKVIYNFVNDEYFGHAINYEPPAEGLKLVAVGNYREQKNYQYLVDAFALLKNKNVSIDIYGQGHLEKMLAGQIAGLGLKIRLLGPHKNLFKILPAYDAYVMCSDFEGFGIAAAEAMAIGLPVLLSRIPVLQEVSQENAYFFNPRNPIEFARLVKHLLKDNSELKAMSEKGKLVAKNYYTREKYINALFDLFDEVLSNKPYRKYEFSHHGSGRKVSLGL